MKIILFSFLIVLTAFAVTAENGKRKGWRKMKCLGEEVQYSKMKDIMKECREENKAKDDEKGGHNKKHMCLMKCFMEKSGVITDNQYNEEKAKDYVSMYPEKAIAPLLEEMKKCSESLKEPSDDDKNCEHLKPFVKCMMKAKKKVCKFEENDEE